MQKPIPTIKTFIRYGLAGLLTTSLLQPLAAQGDLKKVFVPQFVNIDGDENYDYLCNSITEAVKKELRQRFAFVETNAQSIKGVHLENYLYEDESHTKSVAMNIGLLARQDVVIAGGFTIEEKDAKPIHTQVRIIDIAEKKIVADFTMKAAADNNIFQTVAVMAGRIADEAKAVLPSKEEWSKQGGLFGRRGPLLDEFRLGFRAGGNLYLAGWSNYIDPNQPALGVSLSARVPGLWRQFYTRSEIHVSSNSYSRDQDTDLNQLGLDATTTNYYLLQHLFVGLRLSESLLLMPGLGAGMLAQTTDVSGDVNTSLSNTIFVYGGGFEAVYQLNWSLEVVIAYQTLVQTQADVTTYAMLFQAGVNFRL